MVMPAKWAAMAVIGVALAASGAVAADSGRPLVDGVELPNPSMVVDSAAKVAEICRGEGADGYGLGERIVSMDVYQAVCCYEGSKAPDCGVQPTVAEAN